MMRKESRRCPTIADIAARADARLNLTALREIGASDAAPATRHTPGSPGNSVTARATRLATPYLAHDTATSKTGYCYGTKS
jgi:hypothetical protein